MIIIEKAIFGHLLSLSWEISLLIFLNSLDQFAFVVTGDLCSMCTKVLDIHLGATE